MTNKILVVEDDNFLSNAYKIKLTKAGFEVIMAKDGEEAMKELQKVAPSVILLDLMMPIKDGFSVLEDIKKNTKLAKIPIIVTSNLGQKEDIDRAINLGAKDYVIKSDLSLEELVSKIKSYI